jgi:hypothetical protein
MFQNKRRLTRSPCCLCVYESAQLLLDNGLYTRSQGNKYNNRTAGRGVFYAVRVSDT